METRTRPKRIWKCVDEIAAPLTCRDGGMKRAKKKKMTVSRVQKEKSLKK